MTNAAYSSTADPLSIEEQKGVFRLKHLIVNSYMVSIRQGQSWVLVDAGLARTSARSIIRAATRRFGQNKPPEAIILTHGHFDHVGALGPLLNFWKTPVYAHAQELPFLTGRMDYPPAKPWTGGAMAWLSWMYPRQAIDLHQAVHALPADGTIPGMPDWRWVHSPGHTPGQVSLFRESDRTMITGDSFITVRQESFWAVLTQYPRVHTPPAYFTPNWASAIESIQHLTSLQPAWAFTGHGKPMGGEELTVGLNLLNHRLQQRRSKSIPPYKVSPKPA